MQELGGRSSKNHSSTGTCPRALYMCPFSGLGQVRPVSLQCDSSSRMAVNCPEEDIVFSPLLPDPCPLLSGTRQHCYPSPVSPSWSACPFLNVHNPQSPNVNSQSWKILERCMDPWTISWQAHKSKPRPHQLFTYILKMKWSPSNIKQW
jgi:hypothetical protein